MVWPVPMRLRSTGSNGVPVWRDPRSEQRPGEQAHGRCPAQSLTASPLLAQRMSRPYSRLYYEVMEDPKFDGIREDPKLFGSWVLLLLYADMAYPAPTYRPPFITAAAMKRLVASGLVDELSGRRYRMHGLASDREMRSHSARNAAASRWDMPRREEKRKEEKGAAMRPHRNAVDRDPLLSEIRTEYRNREAKES
jgi:hypothetical protein